MLRFVVSVLHQLAPVENETEEVNLQDEQQNEQVVLHVAIEQVQAVIAVIIFAVIVPEGTMVVNVDGSVVHIDLARQTTPEVVSDRLATNRVQNHFMVKVVDNKSGVAKNVPPVFDLVIRNDVSVILIGNTNGGKIIKLTKRKSYRRS